MEHSIFFILLTGILAGSVHVFSGPDHLAAVAPFTANNPRRGWKIGLWWGMGHTSSLIALAMLAFLLKSYLPTEGLSQWSEKLVGIVLIGVGLWSFRKAISQKVHYRVHEHDGTSHAHYHIPVTEIKNKKPHTHAPLGIGVLHGFAGSAHLLAIIPALALPGTSSAASFIAGFGAGTILAMMGFSWLIGVFLQKFIQGFSKAYRYTQVAFAGIAISVGICWLIIN